MMDLKVMPAHKENEDSLGGEDQGGRMHPGRSTYFLETKA